MTADPDALNIRVNGIVQGVGFRPFIFQLAGAHDIRGRVLNTENGVLIHAQGPAARLRAFVDNISKKAPPLSDIAEIAATPADPENVTGFTIVSSKKTTKNRTLISPDVAVCDDCLREMRNPEDRRYRYPFINCTNCGPRYTIIEDIPYDRPKTAMRKFALCPDCRAEYDDPMDRRFHAQPNACPTCGPRAVFLDEKGRGEDAAADPVFRAAETMRAGNIVAVKGLGGFHLVADALNHAAVERLRRRKRREEKPLAVMAPNMAAVETFAKATDKERRLLLHHRRPIVLLEKKKNTGLPPSVSPNNPCIGVMLPYTPLHHLIMDFGFTALVATSGNLSEEPIAIANKEAIRRLGGIADAFLAHDRDIYLRTDDSVVRRVSGKTRLIRRSRGYVPAPVFLPRAFPSVLACGAELKNTVCLTRDDQAFVSQHIGDLENLETESFFRMTIDHLQRILDISPDIIAHDLHPDYLSTRYALSRKDLPTVGVQHHHAHIVGCMAENDRLDEPVIGLALDGTGYGTDGKIWGGEVLLAWPDRFERAAHFEYVPMPGGATAIREPRRMAISYLFHAFGEDFRDLDLPFPQKRPRAETDVLTGMIKAGLNCPETSSLGRLFDGVAALAGIKGKVAFEGQAAMELEAAAGNIDPDEIYAFEFTDDSPRKIRIAPFIRQVVKDIQAGVPVAKISAGFHAALSLLFTELCGEIRRETGISHVALSGGVFQNARLLQGLETALDSRGFTVLTHRKVPANDGGISLGQAVAAGYGAGRTI